MASRTVPCGGNLLSALGVDRRSSNPNRPPNRTSQSDREKRRPRMSVTTASSSVSALFPVNPRSGALFPGNLDEWIRDSAAEIVKNLRKGPLLVQVYANDKGESARLETEKAIAEDWSAVTRRWKDGEAPAPDGVVLVEEIDNEENGTKAWGIMIQGKGAGCGGPACYLMKTSEVCSSMGLCCTHFCLVKVQDFRQSALSQLTNAWLLD